MIQPMHRERKAKEEVKAGSFINPGSKLEGYSAG
jgi:hypothetical protein